MHESTKNKGAEFSNKESGMSASMCKISTSHDNVEPEDGPESSSASAPESSVSLLHSLDRLSSDDSSLCEPQPITSSSVLETAALLSGIAHMSSQVTDGIQIAQISDTEVSVYDEESQITITLLQEDLYVFDTDDIDHVAGVVLESTVCYDERQPDVDDLGGNNDTAYRPIRDKDVVGVSSRSSDIKRDSRIDNDGSSFESEDSSAESDTTSDSDDNSSDGDVENEATSGSDDSSADSNDERDNSSDSDDTSADSDDDSDDISDSTDNSDDSDEEGANYDAIPAVRRRPLLKASDILRPNISCSITTVDFPKGGSFNKCNTSRKRKSNDDSCVYNSKRRRPASPKNPYASPGVSRNRKRRASSPFDEERYKHVLKKRKLSPDRQFTYGSCPGTCPCKTRGRTAMIPPIERKYKVIQPLYERLLKSRTMESTNVSTYQCCDKHCRFRWLRKRIPNYDLLQDYWPLDLDVHTFSWGRWKDGEGHVC